MHEVYSYIDFRNQKHSNFSGLKRIDKRDYPEVAIREALLNLIVHNIVNIHIVQVPLFVCIQTGLNSLPLEAY